MMSMMVSFCAVLFPFFVLDGTLDPVSGGGGGGGGVPTYSSRFLLI